MQNSREKERNLCALINYSHPFVHKSRCNLAVVHYTERERRVFAFYILIYQHRHMTFTWTCLAKRRQFQWEKEDILHLDTPKSFPSKLTRFPFNLLSSCLAICGFQRYAWFSLHLVHAASTSQGSLMNYPSRGKERERKKC